MVEHLVLFKLQDDAEDAMVETMIRELLGLRAIKEVEAISCGRNFSDRNRGHQVGLRVLFADREALDTYQDHKLHVDCVEQFVKPILEHVTVVDYEVGETPPV